jgi:hypothetical protein
MSQAPHEHRLRQRILARLTLWRLACVLGVISGWEVWVRFETFSFGSIRIDGMTYEHDLVIDRGEIRKRKKRASKQYRDAYGHTPLSAKEDIPWRCRRLVVGTGAEGRLPVMDEVRNEAQLRKVELLSLPTKDAIAILNGVAKDTNAILHVTC